MGSHDLRDCGRDHCARDRMAFRDAIEPLLTKVESVLLFICDLLHPRIAAALEEASADIMETLAKSLGLERRTDPSLGGTS